VPGLREVYIWLCSQIGKPIDQALIASSQLALQHDVALADVRPAVESVIAHQLTMINDFTARLIQREWTGW
jgi:S-adenosylmethionine synthetase